MQQRWKWFLALAVMLLALSGSIPAAYAGAPDVTLSYYVPQSGSVTTPTEGTAAIANFRRCPNDDGTQVLRFGSRLKVVARASDGTAIANIPAADVCALFNGGTGANFGLNNQGFAGVGADSIIANFQYNPAANCPDVRCVQADAPTDANGVTYITWLGTAPGQPGVGARDPFRKWGGYDGNIPVMVLGFALQGRLTTVSPLGSYTAHVKSLDFVNGYTTALNQGEIVNSADIAPVQVASNPPTIYPVNSALYKFDFDNSGRVDSVDLAFIKAHNNHRCNSPLAN